MTKVLTWNIQCGKGVDDRVDLVRIAEVILDMADVDVICLQEISRFNSELDGGKGEDQVKVLCELFPDHKPFFGIALDHRSHGMIPDWQFGNLILSRLPVIQVFYHSLPQPVPDKPCVYMPRQALEVIVRLPNQFPFRVTTTHLEFYSENQRLAQALRLRDIQFEINANNNVKRVFPQTGPYALAPRPTTSILCGDFNANPHDNVYQSLISQNLDEQSIYVDAWIALNKNTPHAPTCGLFDHTQWPQGPHCRDFFFITDDLIETIDRIQVQETTSASDHQPVLLEFHQ